MIDQPPPEPQPPLLVDPGAPIPHPVQERADGTVVIDLTELVPPLPSECISDEPDPLNPEILVCKTTRPSPRLGPLVGPVDDGFGSAIPRAKIKLSDTASAEANVINKSVGGFDADGAEVRVKIDF